MPADINTFNRCLLQLQNREQPCRLDNHCGLPRVLKVWCRLHTHIKYLVLTFSKVQKREKVFEREKQSSISHLKLILHQNCNLARGALCWMDSIPPSIYVDVAQRRKSFQLFHCKNVWHRSTSAFGYSSKLRWYWPGQTEDKQKWRLMSVQRRTL